MDAGSGSVTFADGERLFRLALNDEMPAVDFAASEETLFSVRGYALQRLHVAGSVLDRNEQHTISVLPYIRKRGNAFALQIWVFR